MNAIFAGPIFTQSYLLWTLVLLLFLTVAPFAIIGLILYYVDSVRKNKTKKLKWPLVIAALLAVPLLLYGAFDLYGVYQDHQGTDRRISVYLQRLPDVYSANGTDLNTSLNLFTNQQQLNTYSVKFKDLEIHAYSYDTHLKAMLLPDQSDKCNIMAAENAVTNAQANYSDKLVTCQKQTITPKRTIYTSVDRSYRQPLTRVAIIIDNVLFVGLAETPSEESELRQFATTAEKIDESKVKKLILSNHDYKEDF
jgi:hypothetical protein